MANTNTNKIFDRETLLDLTVNMIPLFIILFFVVLFLLYQPWGGDLFPTAIMVGLHVVPFVGLAILTYVSGKAIAGAEKSSTVYYPGQAGMSGAEMTHGESEADGDDHEDAQALESGTEPDGELTDNAASDGDADADVDAETTLETDEETAAEGTEADESETVETDTTDRQQTD
ncbi:DUF6684 family protein [Haloprofundus salilacus]|uniref:DUF6684 family protein n=1 Tax=Haloprofundus salilacus TaxID=2876190 RepID=UPI001CCD9567|nr:DUF6684 family protein [Haloprofundus salilacus]